MHNYAVRVGTTLFGPFRSRARADYFAERLLKSGAGIDLPDDTIALVPITIPNYVLATRELLTIEPQPAHKRGT